MWMPLWLPTNERRSDRSDGDENQSVRYFWEQKRTEKNNRKNRFSASMILGCVPMNAIKTICFGARKLHCQILCLFLASNRKRFIKMELLNQQRISFIWMVPLPIWRQFICALGCTFVSARTFIDTRRHQHRRPSFILSSPRNRLQHQKKNDVGIEFNMLRENIVSNSK